MSKSKSVQVVVGPKRKGGKRGRNTGTGILKLSHSRWRTYQALIEHQMLKRLERMSRRYCSECHVQYHSRGVYLRHVKSHKKVLDK